MSDTIIKSNSRKDDLKFRIGPQDSEILVFNSNFEGYLEIELGEYGSDQKLKFQNINLNKTSFDECTIQIKNQTSDV